MREDATFRVLLIPGGAWRILRPGHGYLSSQNATCRRSLRSLCLARCHHAGWQLEEIHIHPARRFPAFHPDHWLRHVEEAADGSILVDGEAWHLAVHRPCPGAFQEKDSTADGRVRPDNPSRHGRRLPRPAQAVLGNSFEDTTLVEVIRGQL